MKNCIQNFLFIFIFLGGTLVQAQNPFVRTWQTTKANESIIIPTFIGETYNYTVDWRGGDVFIYDRYGKLLVNFDVNT